MTAVPLNMAHILIPRILVDESINRSGLRKRMRKAKLESLPSAKLFDLCATRFEDAQYWEEFVRRFNQSLTRSVYQAYRQFTGEEIMPSLWTVTDLLQEIYLKILQDDCASLRSFRGDAEIEAEVYLMHIATSVTIDRLRRQHSMKRFVHTRSIEVAHYMQEERNRRESVVNSYTDELVEHELIKILRGRFRGKNRERNILIFLLHFRDGFTAQEIASAHVFGLSPHTIAHILNRMREGIREVMFADMT
jgi:RNA polymerase sigma factor (sigma-70 family)